MATSADGALALTSFSTPADTGAATPDVRGPARVQGLQVAGVGAVDGVHAKGTGVPHSMSVVARGEMQVLGAEGASLQSSVRLDAPLQAAPSVEGAATPDSLRSPTVLEAEPKVRPGLVLHSLSSLGAGQTLASMDGAMLVDTVRATGIGALTGITGRGAFLQGNARIVAPLRASPDATGTLTLPALRQAGALGFRVLDHLDITLADALSLTVEITDALSLDLTID